jgi:hypothetical protein
MAALQKRAVVHVRTRPPAQTSPGKTVIPLLRDRIAVFDETDISESCLELDPNQWHYSGAPTEDTGKIQSG